MKQKHCCSNIKMQHLYEIIYMTKKTKVCTKNFMHIMR